MMTKEVEPIQQSCFLLGNELLGFTVRFLK